MPEWSKPAQGIRTGADGRRAIGCHGQTVRHRPGEFDGIGYTVQVNARPCWPNSPGSMWSLTSAAATLLPEARVRLGSGIPRAPVFHGGEATAVLNLGGIANLSAIGADGATMGFDCGPANALSTSGARRHRPGFDAGGAWAATGRWMPSARRACWPSLFRPGAAEEHRARPVQCRMARAPLPSGARTRLRAEDVQATLAELTRTKRADAVRRPCARTAERSSVAEGAFNADLMTRSASLLAPTRVVASSDRGLPPDQVEACAFAWLARAFVQRQPATSPPSPGRRAARPRGALSGRRRARDVKKPPRGGFRQSGSDQA
jgi:anhydro-N-acetylmuramic acid kinase